MISHAAGELLPLGRALAVRHAGGALDVQAWRCVTS